ncbi:MULTISPECIES: conjugal transfer protein MobA [Bacteroidaceae]|uniref:conjugal transfer protein MobA n=1 Tax=Bacteroidaceae TaxID=815 RepID=UPI0015E6E9A4|nr:MULTISPECIES: conjugal transfer protein MobA [Bacteroidaceae]MCE8489297.1 MobA protein [Bacteroides thetaiotaomicron]
MEDRNRRGKRKGTGRKPKTDPAVFRYGIKLTSEENGKFELLFERSGMKQRARFIKAMIFGREMKVVRIDKVSMDYYIRLTELYRQFQAIGNNYNQVVRAVKNNFGEKRAMALLHKLEKSNLELMLVCKKVIALTEEYGRKWLQR